MNDLPTSAPNRAPSVAITAAIIGVLLCLAGAWVSPLWAWSVLPAWLFWLSVSWGCLSLVLVHHLTGGAWGIEIMTQSRAAARLAPLTMLAGLILLPQLQTLYPWARSAEIGANAIIASKAAYLNEPSFLLRQFIYLGIIGVLAWLLAGGRSDREVRAGRWTKAASGLGLVAYVYVVTFASVDWVMSLTPEWYSAVFGVLFVVSNGLTGLAFCLVARYWPEAAGARSAEMLPHETRAAAGAAASIEPPAAHVHHEASPMSDLGNLLLALTMLWTYIAFSQYLIIWFGNLPEEVTWYVRRGEGGWQWVAMTLIGLHFVVPFFLLLARVTKLRSGRLWRVAMLLLAMRWVDLWWLTRPAREVYVNLHWLDFAAMAGIGGAWAALFLWQAAPRRASLVPSP